MLECSEGKVPTPGRRRSLGADVTRRENFRQKRVERFDEHYLIKARTHSAGRNEGVAELLCYLSFMRNLGDISADASVNWDKAHVQAIKGRIDSNAAHALPCQVLISRQYPWNLVRSTLIHTEHLRSGLRELFGRVWILPKAFNLADCIAESTCLRRALVAACQKVLEDTKPIERGGGVLKRGVGGWQAGHKEPSFGMIQLRTSDIHGGAKGGIHGDAVHAGFKEWRTQAADAFERAMKKVEEDGVTYDEVDYTDDVLYILAKYKESLDVPPAKLGAAQISRLEQSLWLAAKT
jgi:hypothetical protein